MTSLLLLAAAVLEGAFLRGTTDRPALSYRCGETMVFSLQVQELKGPVPAGCKLVWTRTGDDGVKETGDAPVPVDSPFVYRTTLAKPGFVRLVARVVDGDGKKVANNRTDNVRDATAPVSFDGGAAAEPEKLESVPEPADFDAFWNRRKAELSLVPMQVEKVECPSDNPAVRVFAVSIACAGPRPATGFLTIPADASPRRRYPVRLTFEGYGCRIPRAPRDGSTGEIQFLLNAFGYELLGKDKAYYEAFFESIRAGGQHYALSRLDHPDPETAFFGQMSWRVMRSLDYLASLPEWDGKTLYAKGGSQAGMMSLWAAALDSRVTRAEVYFPWCCDLGGADAFGRNRRTWGVEWTSAMGYYDPVNLAKRISCPVLVGRAGLGDYTCPPSGLAVLWNNLRCRKKIVWVQGATHDGVPPGDVQQWVWEGDGPASEPVAVRFEDDGRALRNPDMGWVMHYYDNGAKYGTFLAPGDSLAWFPGCNVVYLRLPWGWLEPEEGRFNWNAIDTPAQQWIARGAQIAFRITVSETLRDATPAWVARAGAKTIRWNWPTGRDPNGRFWECVPDDPVFLEKFGNFLRAFAARYDGRPEVAFIDVGSVGIWGEGHTDRTIGLSPEETQRIVKTHVDLHRQFFKRSRLVVNDDYTCSRSAQTSAAMEYALGLGLGWRDDSIMVDSPRDRGWDYYFHSPQALRFAEKAPTVLEIGHYAYLKRKGNWSESTLLKAIEDHRASYLSIHGDPKAMLEENPSAIRKANVRLGYRFLPRAVVYPSVVQASPDPARARPFAVSFSFANVGAAPCYREAYPCLTLKTRTGGIAAVLADGDFNLRTLKPAAPGAAVAQTHEATFTLGRWQAPVLPPGDYEAFLSVGMADGTPVFDLPISGGGSDRRFRLGAIRVVSGGLE